MSIKDLLYPALTIGFFVAMAAYVRFCSLLGHADPDAGGQDGTR
ncbi:MAG TPA: hypothetical protein VM764_08105 [Gemmatimonadaceae bacterium]|nr:hypothetical protein [Gemmatimonadaceae bacterium]